MGSSGSTARPGSETVVATSSSDGRRGRSSGNWGFPMSCLRSASGSQDRDDDEQVCSHRNRKRCDSCVRNLVTEGVDQMDADCYDVLEDKSSDDKDLCISPDVDLDDCGEANGTDSNQVSSARTSSPSRVFSHFRFIPGNLSSRLSRASSWRSPNSYPVPSSSMFNGLEDVANPHSEIDETERQRRIGLLPVSQFNRAIIQDSEATSASDPRSNTSTVHVPDSFHADQRMSSLHTASNASHWDGTESSYSNRRVGDREPLERNVRFSRTLSVGRLRDRVLRRSPYSDFAFCPLQLQGEISNESTGDGINNSVVQTRALHAEEDHGLSSSSISRPLTGLQDRNADNLGSREASYRDLLEHRSNFFERRRRIRSQVRALRRLGSQIENVPGHDRACALSRQNQTGRCTCRVGNRNSHSTDETGAGGSISRIVMLAEALFEVLDEIQQQSVVLSSQPSASSIGSIPAPSGVVDSLPVKLYTRSQRQRHDDAAQCYICLVEYEEGDSIRLLPCHHEFHTNCVDKWLKEIHRVCPLCRGDICKRSDSTSG